MATRLSPEERERRRAERVRRSFSNEGYKHYDPGEAGFGSYQDWIDAAERLASGGGTYRHEPFHEHRRDQTHRNPDLVTLGLESMPSTTAELVSAFRKRAMETHPDRGGNAKDFTAVYAAYERLIRRYA